ncbi:MAG: hypothetical protein H0T92_21500 [Pyrinomonadaceae bacterium]|nr:hypothetical protein [Pyrinomonadaceae bacterium]
MTLPTQSEKRLIGDTINRFSLPTMGRLTAEISGVLLKLFLSGGDSAIKTPLIFLWQFFKPRRNSP